MIEEQMVTNVRHTHTLHPKKQRNETNFIKKKRKNIFLYQNQNQHHSSCFFVFLFFSHMANLPHNHNRWLCAQMMRNFSKVTSFIETTNSRN